jgi:UDP-N-acetylglucosamine:LPS N-acetylglucosamine transferase
MSGLRYLVVSAGMGAGHHGVAHEIERRVTADGDRAEVVDLLELLPARLGHAARAQYRFMLEHLPGGYEKIFASFSEPGAAYRTVSPLVRLAEPGLERLVRDRRPDVVVSTFHVAGAVAGRLRRQGALRRPSVVVINEFTPHRVWLAPGNDAYLCMTEDVRREAAQVVGDRAVVAAPFVRPELRPVAGPDRVGGPAGGPGASAAGPGRRLVLVSSGSWGCADGVEVTAAALVASGRYFPLVLCGRNERLVERIRRAVGPAHAWGWEPDMAGLLRNAYALIDNAGGLTATEAFRVGVPVVVHAPLPGHGRAAAERMAGSGLVSVAERAEDLPGVLDTLACDGVTRVRQIERGLRLFDADGTALLRRLAQRRG